MVDESADGQVRVVTSQLWVVKTPRYQMTSRSVAMATAASWHATRSRPYISTSCVKITDGSATFPTAPMKLAIPYHKVAAECCDKRMRLQASTTVNHFSCERWQFLTTARIFPRYRRFKIHISNIIERRVRLWIKFMDDVFHANSTYANNLWISMENLVFRGNSMEYFACNPVKSPLKTSCVFAHVEFHAV